MELLHSYINGNYSVSIFDDGTKIRYNKLDHFDPQFPESIDLKATNLCDMGCAACHENSTPDGKHGDLSLPFLSTLRPGTELAIGGGNPLAHPDLIPFLERMKEQGVICNITVNQKHFEQSYGQIKSMQMNGLIHGVGISPYRFDLKFLMEAKSIKNLVLHFIVGYHDPMFIKQFEHKNFNALFLGFKEFRRGKDYFEQKMSQVTYNMWDLRSMIAEYVKPDKKNPAFTTVCFDNLALEQLHVKEMLPAEQWEAMYMGDDGSFTMYVDAVEQTYSPTSTTPVEARRPIEETIDTMFAQVRMWNVQSA